MTTDLLLKIFYTVIFSGMFSWTVFSRYDADVGEEQAKEGRRRYLPYVSSMVLPVFLGVITLLELLSGGIRPTLQMVLSMCFGIFLHISVYYLLLLLLLPVLRRYISSRACAMLWIIPNYLYITSQSYMSVAEPLIVLKINSDVLWVMVYIWLAGFAAVLMWKFAEHLCFRRRVLKNAKAVSDPNILEIWNRELADARIRKPKYRLVTSSAVVTPLSIGFFERTIRVILPQREYSEEELSLILRHEIIHICRGDSDNKFFLVFCAAMCWFNPLMWVARRRSADDLELSCDETVLLDADDHVRRCYADLLLRTAGNEQGFTTCLSASASALRYRLKNIVAPRQLYSGAILVGLVFFVLCMSCGHVALAYDGTTGQAVVFPSGENSLYEIESISFSEHDTYFSKCVDSSALKDYLEGLEISKMTGNFSFDNDERKLLVIFTGPEGHFAVELRNRTLVMIPLGVSAERTGYYVNEPVDWDYICSLLAAQEDESFLPELTLEFDDPSLPSLVYCNGAVTSCMKEGQVQPEEDWWGEEVMYVCVADTDASQVKLHFSKDPYPDPYLSVTVMIESLEDSSIQHVRGEELDTFLTLPLVPYSACYTVRADFMVEDALYQMEFSFDVKREGEW